MNESTAGKQRILVIIPTYNEIENIADVLGKVLNQPIGADILIIDDNSPDGTGQYVEEETKKNPRLHILKRPGKMGLGTAYVAGFKYAIQNQYDYIFEMDADLSHDPNELPNFMKAIAHADLVIGSRYINGVNVVNWPLRRLLLSYFASVYTRVLTGLPVRDTTSGFKCFRRKVLETIDLDSLQSSGYSFQVEMHWLTWKHHFIVKEMPIIFVDRTIGKSKMSKKIVREAILMVWKLAARGLFFHPKPTSDATKAV